MPDINPESIGELNPFTNPIKITCEAADSLPLAALTDFQGNLKRLPTKSRDKLLRSICAEGFMCPVFIWKREADNMLLDGHQRIKTLTYMQEKGWEAPDLPVVYIEAGDEKEARRKLLKITSQYGEFELDELNSWLADMDDDIQESIRLVDTELEIDIPVDTEETEGDDEVPEDVEPITKLGDLWELNNHRLLCGDSTKQKDVESLINNQKIDLVHTDPPYGISEKGDRSKRKGESSLSDGVEYKDFNDDTIDYAISAFNICENLKIPRQVWWGANYYAHHVPQSNNWFVWDKRVEDKQKDTQSDCELAWVKSKWSSVRIFRHLWKGLIEASENGEARVHPTQKPIVLAEWVYDYYKDIKSVLDLFGGSGFNLIACERTDRQSYTMEFEPHYCDVIVQRYIDWMEKNNRPYTIKRNGEVYAERK